MCKCNQKSGESVASMPVARAITPPGASMPGDVLARVVFERGVPTPKSGRRYPYMKRGELWFVSPIDAAQYPNWFAPVMESENA